MTRVLARTAALAMSVLAIPAATATQACAASDYTIGQFNMAGGNATYGEPGDKAPDDLVSSVNDRKPMWLTLQEFCADWNKRLEDKLPEYKIVFNVVKKSKKGSTAQCGGNGKYKGKHPSDFGNSILFRKDFGFGPLERTDLESSASLEQREMLCIKAPAKKVVVCTIHLSNGDDKEHYQSRNGEAAAARKKLAEEYAGYQVFLGGDLNDDPMSKVTDNFYQQGYGSGAHGNYKEVDSPCGNRIQPSCRSGHPTSNATKIDYIFVSPSVKVRWATVGKAKHSDHNLLWSGVSF